MYQETGWICPKCGQFNALTQVCSGCGKRPGRVGKTPEPLRQRVNEDDVARILSLVANPPNLRVRPVKGDLAGEFNAWFDGGALRIDSSWKIYFFTNKTKVWISTSASWLWVQIEYSSGERVVIKQEKGPK
jgi:hypothetical protein